MDIARHVRIFELDPDDDFVTKRTAVVDELQSEFAKQRVSANLLIIPGELCRVFSSETPVAEPLATQLEAVIRKHSASFVRDDKQLEMGVCGLLAATQLVLSDEDSDDEWSVANVMAVGLWSALSFLPSSGAPKLEALRAETVQASRTRILTVGLEARKRHTVPAFGAFGAEATTPDAFESATRPTVDALRANAALDREEINLLWWAINEWSDIFDSPLRSLSPATRAIVSGLELGAMTHALPTAAYRNLALRTLGKSKPVSLPDLLVTLANDRPRIAEALGNDSFFRSAPLVFPLLQAINSGEATGTAADVRRSLAEWTARALLERAVLGLIMRRSNRNA